MLACACVLAGEREGRLVSWIADTYSEISLIVKYGRGSLASHSLQGVVNDQGFVVMGVWEGCNSIGTGKFEDS